VGSNTRLGGWVATKKDLPRSDTACGYKGQDGELQLCFRCRYQTGYSSAQSKRVKSKDCCSMAASYGKNGDVEETTSCPLLKKLEEMKLDPNAGLNDEGG
jgi:hypothetical protein